MTLDKKNMDGKIKATPKFKFQRFLRINGKNTDRRSIPEFNHPII
jgi:hypothetical protein